jgi:hypothetical protein
VSMETFLSVDTKSAIGNMVLFIRLGDYSEMGGLWNWLGNQ